jgi:hypothetical protein
MLLVVLRRTLRTEAPFYMMKTRCNAGHGSEHRGNRCRRGVPAASAIYNLACRVLWAYRMKTKSTVVTADWGFVWKLERLQLPDGGQTRANERIRRCPEAAPWKALVPEPSVCSG